VGEVCIAGTGAVAGVAGSRRHVGARAAAAAGAAVGDAAAGLRGVGERVGGVLEVPFATLRAQLAVAIGKVRITTTGTVAGVAADGRHVGARTGAAAGAAVLDGAGRLAVAGGDVDLAAVSVHGVAVGEVGGASGDG